MLISCVPSRITRDDSAPMPWGHKLDFVLALKVDDETRELKKTYFMRTLLWLGHSEITGNPKARDFQFGILNQDHRNDRQIGGPVFDHREAKRLLDQNGREKARARVAEAAGCLAAEARADIITMSTYDAALPDKALEKYWMIVSCLRCQNYRLEDTWTGKNGKCHWLFRREA